MSYRIDYCMGGHRAPMLYHSKLTRSSIDMRILDDRRSRSPVRSTHRKILVSIQVTSTRSTVLRLLPIISLCLTMSQQHQRFFGPCRNKKCDHGCGFFILPGAQADLSSSFDTSPTPALLAARCLVCDCFGAQHLYQDEVSI